ncbi:hypothetical protein BH09BAC3_BH09BAC3_36130 [soil metagenome]
MIIGAFDAVVRKGKKDHMAGSKAINDIRFL